MRKQSGNFLLQALLALTLVFAFMPFFANKLSSRDMQARLYSVSGQVETLYTAARIYLRENRDSLEIGEHDYAGENMAFLEEYGLPMGFVPKTIFGQEMSLYINKRSTNDIEAHISLSAGEGLRRVDQVELTRMIGFYATANTDGTIKIDVPIDEIYSDIVLRNERDETVGFMVDLDMDGNSIDGINFLGAVNGNFSTATFSSLFVTGAEDENCRLRRADWQKTIRDNTIPQLVVKGTSTFQTPTVCNANALSLTQSDGVINVGHDVSAFKIMEGSTAPNFEGPSANVDLFSSNSFEGPSRWDIDKSLNGTEVIIDAATEVKTASGNGIIYGAKHSGVYELNKSKASGITTDELYADVVVFHNEPAVDAETSVRTNINAEKQEVRIELAGTSVLPDLFINDEGVRISSDDIHIITNPQNFDAVSYNEYVDTPCGNILGRGDYYAGSLSVNIVCQYLFWDRMDRLINYKRCKKDGNCQTGNGNVALDDGIVSEAVDNGNQIKDE